MIRNVIILCVCLFALSGCTSSSYSPKVTDSKTGKSRTMNYSKFFLAEGDLIAKKISYEAIAEIHSKPKSKDMIKPTSDSNWTYADIKINLYNKSESTVPIHLDLVKSLDNKAQEITINQMQKLVLIPKTIKRIELNDQKIDLGKANFPLLVVFTMGSERTPVSINLKRLTPDEYKEYKSKK